MTDNYYLAQVPALHVEELWYKILPHLMKGKEYWEDFFTERQILSALVLGRQQVWIMVEKGENKILCVVLTQLDEFPLRKVFRILYLGGEDLYPGMMREMARLEKWALDHGATMVDFLGRKEWKGLVARLGYTSPGMIFRKELN